MSGNEAQVVTADAQFSVAKILRPASDFTTLYEGVTAADPIYLFPEGNAIDQLARDGKSGYDPQLARALPVPIGSRVLLWLPNLFYTDGGDFGYRYTLIWRLRNVFDFNNASKRSPYHFPRDRGVADTTQPAGEQARLPIPAAYNTLSFIQTEPVTERAHAISNVHGVAFEASSTSLTNPRFAGSILQPIQQGVLDPSVITDAESPGFMTHVIQEALGDELLVAVTRSPGGVANWTFATTDLRLANFFAPGAPDVGVYAFTGTAP